MTIRKTRTPEQRAKDAELKARALRTKANNVERARRTRQLILQGEGLAARIAAGDLDAKGEWDKTLASLKRVHDRAAFGLEPLPEPRPDDQQPVNPPPVVPPRPAGPVDVQARLDRAVAAWKSAQGSPHEVLEPLRVELGRAIAGIERVSGQLSELLEAKDRKFYGLGDRPGELV